MVARRFLGQSPSSHLPPAQQSHLGLDTVELDVEVNVCMVLFSELVDMRLHFLVGLDQLKVGPAKIVVKIHHLVSINKLDISQLYSETLTTCLFFYLDVLIKLSKAIHQVLFARHLANEIFTSARPDFELVTDIRYLGKREDRSVSTLVDKGRKDRRARLVVEQHLSFNMSSRI